MTGSILIVDSVATNRIVMKVKLVAAQYQVLTAATCADAKAILEQQKPDLLLINLSDPIEDSHAFCSSLRASPGQRDLAIVAIGVADTNRARFAALDAGVDDVLPRPISDALMFARIRGLLRRRNANLEWAIRDETSRALGFREDAAPRLRPEKICLLPAFKERGPMLEDMFRESGHPNAFAAAPAESLLLTDNNQEPDLFVVEIRAPETCSVIVDILSRPALRSSEILVLAPNNRPDIAAQALDLGAGDVAFDDISAQELSIRVANLLKHKRRADSQKENVRTGLEAAVKDPLTGLYNRRYAETYLQRMAEQAFATGKSYALMVFDIDHFKQINDRFGHSAGDQILVKLADRLRANFRAIDLIARIGGEECLIGMPDTSLAQAQIAAERMRRMVSRKTFLVSDGSHAIRVTISAGVAVDQLVDQSPVPTPQLFDQADAALYEAKSSGRDKVSISSFAA